MNLFQLLWPAQTNAEYCRHPDRRIIEKYDMFSAPNPSCVTNVLYERSRSYREKNNLPFLSLSEWMNNEVDSAMNFADIGDLVHVKASCIVQKSVASQVFLTPNRWGIVRKYDTPPNQNCSFTRMWIQWSDVVGLCVTGIYGLEVVHLPDSVREMINANNQLLVSKDLDF